MRYPVSFAQRRLLALEQNSPGDPAARLPYGVWLRGTIDHDALQRALDVLVARHAALRTVVVSSAGGPEQVVEDTGSVAVERAVLAEDDALSFALDLAARPFDLARGPLLRAALIETASDRSLFVLVAHRVVADEAGLAVLLDELSTVYHDPAVVLPRLWMDYGDYAVWQLDWLRGEELTRQVEPWRAQLRNAPRALAMPTDRPRRTVRSTRAAVATATIAPDTMAELAELARVSGTDPASAVLAGYAMALSRYARQRDLLIGVAVDGRVRPELVPVVGPFADTVPVRVRLGDTTFAELLAQVGGASAQVRASAELPYELLAAELDLAPPPVRFGGPGSDPGVLSAPRLPGVTAEDRIAFPRTTESDLNLIAADDGSLTLGYRTDLFHAPFATRLLRSVVTVLEHAARDPELPIADLPLLPAPEHPAPAVAVPDNGFDVLTTVCESSAAVTDGAGTVLMPVVRDRAARLARTLIDHGVGPGSRVGLCVGRGTGLLTAVLGVWWAGGAVVPLDPAHPLPWLRDRVRDADLRLLVADDAHGTPARSLGEVLTLNELGTAPAPPVAVDPDSLAYSVFVSTTRVDVTHRAVAAVLGALRGELGLGGDDRFLAVTTTAADLALLELVLPLVCGADLVIAADEARDGDRLRALVERSAATAMHATAYTWRLLTDHVPARLRLRLCTGEPDRGLAEALTSPGSALWHLYGHAGTAGWAAAIRAGERPVLLGGHRLGVLDERGTPVPIGVVGEVHVAGVATGDLGRWREDGGLARSGRTDGRVTVRGAPVDPGDVAAVLRAHDAVRDVVVVGVPRAGDTALVAYVAVDPEADREADLLAHVRAAVPEPMVPALVVVVPELDRDALPEPEWPAEPGEGKVRPRNPVEADLAGIWAELLGTTEPIGVHDNLFGFGGGSLAAVRFAARIADTYGVTLPMHSIVATPTIAQLAEIVSAAAPAAEPDTDLVALSDDELDDLLRAVLADRDRRRAVKGEGT
ncbi:condensation domain-containing protein [Labedaea rhizosphaerae]|uniref:Non-ribosomal peptide synthetase component F n=1 Tax=Labedaea rhizosphaerae TaxID=598644 RepID=A0A4R6S195_LABRH|nr:condensation domain-containing protein [Labedaea rhizosphaerae]TDP93003.1 non-ribosomal peptide synthetase component F [Labedaea rhizosphaerae]